MHVFRLKQSIVSIVVKSQGFDDGVPWERSRSDVHIGTPEAFEVRVCPKIWAADTIDSWGR